MCLILVHHDCLLARSLLSQGHEIDLCMCVCRLLAGNASHATTLSTSTELHRNSQSNIYQNGKVSFFVGEQVSRQANISFISNLSYY